MADLPELVEVATAADVELSGVAAAAAPGEARTKYSETTSRDGSAHLINESRAKTSPD